MNVLETNPVRYNGIAAGNDPEKRYIAILLQNRFTLFQKIRPASTFSTDDFLVKKRDEDVLNFSVAADLGEFFRPRERRYLP